MEEKQGGQPLTYDISIQQEPINVDCLVSMPVCDAFRQQVDDPGVNLLPWAAAWAASRSCKAGGIYYAGT